jgi:hypothetical protein
MNAFKQIWVCCNGKIYVIYSLQFKKKKLFKNLLQYKEFFSGTNYKKKFIGANPTNFFY